MNEIFDSVRSQQADKIRKCNIRAIPQWLMGQDPQPKSMQGVKLPCADLCGNSLQGSNLESGGSHRHIRDSQPDLGKVGLASHIGLSAKTLYIVLPWIRPDPQKDQFPRHAKMLCPGICRMHG